MTELLYLRDSYIREFEAEVVLVYTAENAIVLDNTAFYPTGGGQPCDLGEIEYYGDIVKVKDVKRADGRILHYLEGEIPQKGDKIIGRIDWKRRYQLMRTHTAMHAMSAVAWRDYQAQVTGGNMEPLAGRLDFEFENFNAELVAEIEEKVNIEIKKGLKVSAQILPRAEAEMIPDLIRTKIDLLPPSLTEIRVVTIEGLDQQADGGTHVHNTSEIGTIKIAGYKSKGRINKRIKIEII
ncbi:MAG: alanyl-tRNA editing protein [Candidatus Cloacimonetes bacterium]|nr:alanyl-tRNA editing protein [Candidatus Cloacimonadota bacterium]